VVLGVDFDVELVLPLVVGFVAVFALLLALGCDSCFSVVLELDSDVTLALALVAGCAAVFALRVGVALRRVFDTDLAPSCSGELAVRLSTDSWMTDGRSISQGTDKETS
jgi:hypothetical protein